MGKKKKKSPAPRPSGTAPRQQRPGENMKKERPGTYYGLVALATALLITPTALFDSWFPQGGSLGWLGALCLGLGLFNIVYSRIKGYRWQYVSLTAFAAGAVLLGLWAIL